MMIYTKRLFAKIIPAILLLLVAIVVNNPGYAHISEPYSSPILPRFQQPREIVAIFLKAVERKELVVFDITLERSMLIPVSVEYVYHLDDPVPAVKVYVELKQPLIVPGQKNCRIRAVSAILNDNGHIIESKAYIWID